MIHEDTVEGKPILCLDKGGIHAAEGLLLARYFMFAQVYYHHVRTAYDLHLKQYMTEFLQYSKEKNNIDYTKIDNYIRLTDFVVLDQMMKDYREYPKDRSNIRLKFARKILDRKHHKMIKEVNGDLLAIKDNTEIAYERFEKAIKKDYRDKIADGTILWDVSKKRIDNFEKTNFRICENDKLTYISTHSSILENIKKIDLFRVYLDRNSKIENDLKKVIENEVEGFR
jgi:HD superfamily phosphohydrolase